MTSWPGAGATSASKELCARQLHLPTTSPSSVAPGSVTQPKPPGEQDNSQPVLAPPAAGKPLSFLSGHLPAKSLLYQHFHVEQSGQKLE